MTSPRVLLLRHGRTGFNFETRFQGQIDTALDAVGVAQAELVAKTLAGLLAGQQVRIVSSDLQRAFQTAVPLGRELGVEVSVDPRLREVNAGRWQGLLRDEVASRWPEEYAAWRRGESIRLGGGETREEAGARAAEAIVEAAAAEAEAGMDQAGAPVDHAEASVHKAWAPLHEAGAAVREAEAAVRGGGTLVCVGHGAALRAAMVQLIGIPTLPSNAMEGLRNAHWAELRRISGGSGWRLSTYNVG